MNDEVGGINLSANATIEATYIIPIVIVIVCSFVYILFFSYDRGVINIMTDMSLEELSVCDNTEEYGIYENLNSDTISSIENKICEKLQKRMFLYRVSRVKVEESKSRYRIMVEAELNVSIPVVSGLVKDFENYSYQADRMKYNPCNLIRTMETVKSK